MSGSDVEPTFSTPEQAAEQMRGAIDRLRDQAWMTAPMTTAGDAIPAQPTEQDADA